MTVAKIAIYGFDRLGRAVFQIASRRKDMKVVAIVSRDDARKNAELLSKDAIYDALSREIDYDGDRLVVDGQQVPVLTENVTTQWRELGVDIVIDCYARKASRAAAKSHLEAGAKKVLFSAQGDLVEQICLGVNEEMLPEAGSVISAGGATISAVAPVREIVMSHAKIESMLVTTVDGIVDCFPKTDVCCISPETACSDADSDCRCHRSSQNRALPAPALTASMSEFVFTTSKSISQEELNDWIRLAANEPYYQGIVVTREEAVTSDQAVGESFSAVVDLSQTDVQGGKLASVKLWYDREWGYANRIVEITADFAKISHTKTEI